MNNIPSVVPKITVEYKPTAGQSAYKSALIFAILILLNISIHKRKITTADKKSTNIKKKAILSIGNPHIDVVRAINNGKIGVLFAVGTIGGFSESEKMRWFDKFSAYFKYTFESSEISENLNPRTAKKEILTE